METVAELRKICGKPTKSVRAKFYRGLSYYFTWLLLKLHFTANQVSALGLILGLFSAVLFVTGNYLLFMVASLLFFFSELADYSDGEVARYRRYKKLPDEPLRQLGGLFDALNHIPRPMIFMCLAISFIDCANPLLILSIGFMSAVFCYLDSGFFGLVDNISKVICLKNYKKSTYKSKTSAIIRNHFYSLLLAPIFLGITSILDFLWQINATYCLWLIYALVGAYLFLSKVVRNGYNTMVSRRNVEISEQIHSNSFWWRFFGLLVFGKSNKTFINQFSHLIFYGLVGSLFMDFDHFFIRQFQMVRPFHLPIWFGSIVFVSCYITYLHRCVHKSSLKKSKVETND